jgi:predicted metal-binding protein
VLEKAGFRELVTELKQTALEMGACRVEALPARLVVVDERVRFKCLVPLCSNYGLNLMCPPNIISVAEFRQVLLKYRLVLLIKVESGAESVPGELAGQKSLADAWKTTEVGQKLDTDSAVGSYISSLKESQQVVYDVLGRLESLCLQKGYPLAAGMAAGGCHLCDRCVGPGSACLNPFKARPSAEGLGVDVMATAAKAGIELDFSNSKEVSWMAILLVD